MKKKGVITGATGYIGSKLLKYLLAKDWDLYIITRPTSTYENINDVKEKVTIVEYDSNINTLITFFKEINPDVVFHLSAAIITNYQPEQITTLIHSNIQFGTEILEAMKYSDTSLFIGTGSYWQNYNSEGYNPVDLYAATKEAFEKIVQYYTDAHGIRAITLRLFDVYGEDDRRPKLLNILKEQNEDSTALDISLGEQYLDMVYISDVCSAYLKAYEYLLENKNFSNEIYGVYTGHPIQLKKIIELFGFILDKQLNVNLGGRSYKQREVFSPCLSYLKLPNWEAKISLELGLSFFK